MKKTLLLTRKLRQGRINGARKGIGKKKEEDKILMVTTFPNQDHLILLSVIYYKMSPHYGKWNLKP